MIGIVKMLENEIEIKNNKNNTTTTEIAEIKSKLWSRS